MSSTAQAAPSPRAPAARAAHVVHVAPLDRPALAAALAAAAARLAPEETGLLALVPDRASARLAAEVLHELTADQPALRIVPVTAPARARRLLAGAPAAAAVVATPQDALALVTATAVQMAAIPQLALLGLDAMVADPTQREALEALLAEPDAAPSRVALVAERTDAVDAVLERYLFKAREVQPPHAAAGSAPIEAVLVGPGQLRETLAALLDELDPPSTTLVAWRPAVAAEARAALRGIGVAAGEGLVEVVEAATPAAEWPAAALRVLLELPPTPEALAEARGGEGTRTIVAIAPAERPRLARYAGGPVSVLVPSARRAGARGRIDALRLALTRALETPATAGELALVEPLLARADGAELAAVAVRLLEQAWREAAEARAAAAALRVAPAAATAPAPGVSAPREGGRPRPPARGAREGREGRGGDREGRGGGWRERPERGGAPSFRGGERGGKPRGPRRDDRPARDGDRERPPRARTAGEWSARAPRERTEQRSEWAERGARLGHAKRRVPARPQREERDEP